MLCDAAAADDDVGADGDSPSCTGNRCARCGCHHCEVTAPDWTPH